MSVRRNLPVRMALLALRFYKTYLSLLFAGNCRFDPTCSQYTYQAIERFGMRRGVWLGLKRLLRCHPLSRKFGYDPVPENWNSFSPHLETKYFDAPTTSRGAAGFHESRVTSMPQASRGHQSLADEVHS